MRLRWENVAISIVYLPIYFTAPLNGTNGKSPLTAGSTSASFTLPSVSSSEFTTIFEYARTLEDIGSLEVLDIYLGAAFKCTGNGYIRFQVSGDGGQTFVTMAETSTPTLLPPDSFSGAGSWIPLVESGDNKLIIRCQTRATPGPVSTVLYDNSLVIFSIPLPPFLLFTSIDSRLDILYRKKVLF